VGLLVMTGRYANLLQRGVLTTPGESADFPAADLYDNDPGTIYLFGVSDDSVEPVFEFDGDLGHGDGSFEDSFVGGAPVGWVNASTGAGALNRDTVTFSDGAASLRIETPDTPFALGSAYHDYVVRAGELLRLHFAALGDSTNGDVSALACELRDLDTGQYLNSSMEWQDNSTNFLVDSSSAFTVFDETFAVSPMSYWPKPIRRLRLRFTCNIVTSGDQSVWVDSLFLVPAYDMVSVFGHNLRPNADFEWIASDSESFLTSTTLASFRPTSDKFYHRISTPSTLRYQQVFVGPAVDSLWIGEIVVGLGYHFPRTAVSPIQTTHIDHRVDIPKSLGGVSSRGLARSPRHQKTMAFQFPDEPDTAETGLWREWHDEVFLRSLGGHPAVVVPTTDRVEVLFGHLSGLVSESDGAPGQAGYKLLEGFVVDELQLPVEIPSATA
jgi:hypothetical protein